MARPILNAQDRAFYNSALADLVRIPSRSSPTGGEEGALQAVVIQHMEASGARVDAFLVDDVPTIRNHPLFHGPNRHYANRPTVLGEVGPADAPALLLAAHSDTVQLDCMRPAEEWTVDPFGAEISDGRMFGLGVGDDKHGVAALLTILSALKQRGISPNRRIIFASTIDEEHGVGNGLLLVAQRVTNVEASIYLDGGEGRIGLGLLGGSNLYLRADASRIDADEPAITALCERLSAERASLFERSFYERNVVRHESVSCRRRRDAAGEFLMLPFYMLPGETRENFTKMLERAVSETLGDRIAAYDLSYREPWFEPCFVDPATPHVAALAESVAAATGRPAVLTTQTKQDAFVLNNHAGIPSVSFGAATMTGPGRYHMPDESLDLDLAWQCCNAVWDTVLKWLNEEF